MDSVSRDIGALLSTTRTNALLGWGLFVLVVVTALTSLVVGQRTWSLFALGLAVLVVIPPVTLRSPQAMIPWEIILLGAVPVLVHSLVTFPLFGRVTMYLSVAAIALVVAIELHTFTSVQMTVGFAVLFVVITTLAAAGIWAVVRWLSDLYLGTGLVLDPALTPTEQEEQLMWDFVASTVAGVLAGAIFQVYVRRRALVTDRLPEGM